MFSYPMKGTRGLRGMALISIPFFKKQRSRKSYFSFSFTFEEMAIDSGNRFEKEVRIGLGSGSFLGARVENSRAH